MSKPDTRWIMHLDMDAFFASVEQRDHPEFRGLPLVVGALPGNRGVVCTCSYEARRFGIHSAMPISEAYRRCPDAIFIQPNMKRYAAVSRQVMQALGEISPVVEAVSIDEAYLDISGLERLFGGPEEIGQLAKGKILERVGLGSSVGIGPNRLIAKLASDYRKPNGLVVVRPDEVRGFLDPMPVSNLLGVGRQTEKIIKRLGIRNIAQLRGYSLMWLQQHFGAGAGRCLYDQASGIALDRVGGRKGRQSISKESTFNQDETDRQRLRGRLRSLAAEVARTARREGLKGRVVTLKIRLEGFETHTRQRRLGQPLDSDDAIFQTAWELYRESGHEGRAVRLIGVGISGWDEGNSSGDLFAPPGGEERRRSLYATLDEVNERFGDGKLSLGLD